jgi:hypothetical protein
MLNCCTKWHAETTSSTIFINCIIICKYHIPSCVLTLLDLNQNECRVSQSSQFSLSTDWKFQPMGVSASTSMWRKDLKSHPLISGHFLPNENQITCTIPWKEIKSASSVQFVTVSKSRRFLLHFYRSL